MDIFPVYLNFSVLLNSNYIPHILRHLTFPRVAFYYALKEKLKMMILFWICFALTVLMAIFTFMGTLVKRTTEDRVISFIAFVYHLAMVYLLASSYL